MSLGLLAIRVVLGLLFVGHGSQKLFGSFGGHGIAGTGGFFESLGLRPGRPMAIAAGLSELVGGLLLALGLLTPLAALLIISTMVTAIWTVHAAKGVWITEGGYEYNLVVIVAVFAVAAVGAGAWSLDSALGLGVAGTVPALVALAAGVIGGSAAVLFGRRDAQTAASGAPSTTPA